MLTLLGAASAVSAAPAPDHSDRPLPATADGRQAATGRRILSTAFVRVGPDNLVTVTLRGGRALVLRNIKMGPASFCGQEVSAGRVLTAKRCTDYAEVVAASPGGPSPPPEPDLAAPNPRR